jgi:hypothetical protein
MWMRTEKYHFQNHTTCNINHVSRGFFTSNKCTQVPILVTVTSSPPLIYGSLMSVPLWYLALVLLVILVTTLFPIPTIGYLFTNPYVSPISQSYHPSLSHLLLTLSIHHSVNYYLPSIIIAINTTLTPSIHTCQSFQLSPYTKLTYCQLPYPTTLSIMDPPQVLDNTDNMVLDLILKTEKCSCLDLQIELCPPTQTHPALNLIGKIISNKNFLASVVLDIIQKAWRPHRPVLVKKIDRNIFLFIFEHEIDLKRAFDRRPWTLRGAHLVLKKWRPELTWQEVDFSSSTFWVQVHGLPSLWHDKANLLRIGNRIGKVLDVDLVGDAPPTWHRFTRLRIEIDISAPLISGMFLPRSDLNKLWLALKYERLPEICYNCGIIGHDSKVCNLSRVMILNQFGFKFPAFGDWLRSENALLPNGIYEKTSGTIESGTNKEFRDVALATDNSGTGQGTGETIAPLQAKSPTLSYLLTDQVHAECGTSSAPHAQQTKSEHTGKSSHSPTTILITPAELGQLDKPIYLGPSMKQTQTIVTLDSTQPKSPPSPLPPDPLTKHTNPSIIPQPSIISPSPTLSDNPLITHSTSPKHYPPSNLLKVNKHSSPPQTSSTPNISQKRKSPNTPESNPPIVPYTDLIPAEATYIDPETVTITPQS